MLYTKKKGRVRPRYLEQPISLRDCVVPLKNTFHKSILSKKDLVLTIKSKEIRTSPNPKIVPKHLIP